MYLPSTVLGDSTILRLRFIEKSIVYNEIVHLWNGSFQTCSQLFAKYSISIVALFMSLNPTKQTYRSACDKKRPISQTADRLPFFVAPGSLVPTCARTMLCPDRLVDVIHECKNPERTVRPPIVFHHSHQTRTNFLFRFSADPSHNRCNSTRNRKNKLLLFIVSEAREWLPRSVGHWI